jgi:hypothetical protein
LRNFLVPIAFLATSVAGIGATQNLHPPSDPQAVALASRSIFVLTERNVISDVTLTGTATWTAGSDTETGTATLLALGTGESRMGFASAGGTRTEIRDSSTGTPRGRWIAGNGSAGPFMPHNCWTDAVWFFPPLGSLAGGPNTLLSYVGAETRNGQAVQHIQSHVYRSPDYSRPSIRELSTMNFYLDASTSVPIAITYDVHPDNDAGSNLPVEVEFSDYQRVSGVLTPMHIQVHVQGTLLLDVSVSSALFNSGLQLSEFSIH